MARIKKFERDDVKKLTTQIFSRILYKINFNAKKENQQLLGIDLLRANTQKDLLTISVLRVEETYTKLLAKDNPREIMQKKRQSSFYSVH